MGDRYEKYLRRMAAASVLVTVLCAAMFVSATYALFQISVETGGSPFEVGKFSAAVDTVVRTEAVAAQSTVVSADGVCPAGSYLLNLRWKGNADGHISIRISAPVGTDGQPSSRTAPRHYARHYVFQLPLNSAVLHQSIDPEQEQSIQIPLLLHEPAVITTASTWGLYTSAEGEDVSLLSMDNVVNFIYDGGITFGIPFEGVAVLSGTEGTSGQSVSAEGTEFGPGEYVLTLDWTPELAGHCVLELVSAKEGSKTEGEKFTVRLPHTVKVEGQNTAITIPVVLREKTKITAAFVRGESVDAIDWPPAYRIVFGSAFTAEAMVDLLPVAADQDLTPVRAEAYAPGKYQLKLDWSDSNTDGYCAIVVGSEVYYIDCPKAAETRQRVITLQLLKEASVSVVTGIGALPADVTVLTEDSVVCGAIFTGEVSLAVKPAGEEEPQYFELDPKKVQEIGEYKLSLVPNWAASTVSGHILITVTAPAEEDGGESITAIWYLPCAVDQAPRVLDLILQKGATVKVEFIRGDFAGSGLTVPADGKLTFPVPGEHTGE